MSAQKRPPGGFEHRYDEGSEPLIVPRESRDEVASQLFEIEKGDYVEHLRIQAAVAVAAVRTLFLINAGAIIGILTFIGNTGADVVSSGIRTALAWFISGLVAAAGAQIPGYWSQIQFQEASHRLMLDFLRIKVGQATVNDHQPSGKRGLWAVNIGLALAVISLVCFSIGAIKAVNSLILANGDGPEIVAQPE